MYELIPEYVADVTSATTRKAARFTNEFGFFIYQHVKPQVFRGFTMVQGDSAGTYFIAQKEKAVVDFLYLNLNRITLSEPEVFEEGFRFQNEDTLDEESIIRFARLFNSNRLLKVCELFCKFIEKEKK